MSSIWHKFQSPLPTFVRIIKELERVIVSKGRKRKHTRTSYITKILNSRSKFPNNLLTYIKGETGHTPQNSKVCEATVITPEFPHGRAELEAALSLVEQLSVRRGRIFPICEPPSRNDPRNVDGSGPPTLICLRSPCVGELSLISIQKY